MRSPVPRVLALALVVVLAVGGGVALLGGDKGSDEGSAARAVADPLAYTSQREAGFVAAAARGNAHVLYAKSPGGVRASAARTAAFRPLVEAAAASAQIAPDILEGLVLLESAGRPDAAADPQLEGAVGLTQILAETGRNLLGMRVDPRAALRIGRSLRRAQAKGDVALVRRLRSRRRSVDERFDPVKALAATARYLVIARKALHRDDLAVVSYHMGIGNLQSALRAFGDDDVSYGRLYFDSTPLRHAAAYRKLASLGDDSATDLWRVAAATEIMRLYRTDPAKLDRLATLQNAKNSAEEVLHPSDETPQFATPVQLRAAYDTGEIVALPRSPLLARGLAIDPGMGELADRLGRRRTTYRGLRGPALALLEYLGAQVQKISGQTPLVVTSSVRDERYQRLLLTRNRQATANYSLHTTGWTFDILRSYRSRAQALAFEFELERLQAHDLIAWVREPAAIHVTVSSDAAKIFHAVR